MPRPAPPAAAPGAALAADDAALLAALARREAAAGAAFYERVRPVIDRTLGRLLGAHDPDYEDMAQVALYEVVVNAARFRHECPFDAWLSIVSARVVYRHIRRRRVERRLFARAPLDVSSAAATAQQPVPFAARQALERIRSHLERMDAKRSWTFLLHDVYGYGLEQIGEIMDTSVSAAQSRLVRGRREIHERIEGDPELAHYLDDLSEDLP